MEAMPGETVALLTELPESGLDVTWLKDNVPLSMAQGKYETINNDFSYQLVIADVMSEDSGAYTAQGGGYQSTVVLSVMGMNSSHL